VTYLQNWMVFFYPERLDLFQEAADLAKSLGGELNIPRFSWKYAWIEKMFGRSQAKRAQVMLPRIKWSLVRGWDKTLLRLENRKLADSLGR